MKLVDTNIFIYAQGGDHPLRRPCQEIVLHASLEAYMYAIDMETLQEILHVYGRRNERSTALRSFDDLLRLFPNPIGITIPVFQRARDLFAAYPRLAARDAIHAAVALSLSLEGLVSAETAFRQIPGLRVWHPTELA